ncbi:uncharacterized protein LOC62_05G007746 [Vanrija pseudolonga]|uniref:Uncharacterized protein n=1 Tax=Vanrija pseudolonga TaxID=143232 RepID=A0AAF1BPL3_9TREE|nr:hypothetical protein LOC62_05G007746 [Vanrija pseudolonga]
MNALCRRQRQRQVQQQHQHRRATESSLASFNYDKPRWAPLPLDIDEDEQRPSPPQPQPQAPQRKRWSLPLPLPRAYSHSAASALPAVNDDEDEIVAALNDRKLFAEWVEPEPEPVAFAEPEDIAPISVPTTPASPPLLTPPLDTEPVTGPSFPARRDLTKPRDKAAAVPQTPPPASSGNKGEWEPLPAFVAPPPPPVASSSSSRSEKWAPLLPADNGPPPPPLPEKGAWAPTPSQAAPPPYPGPSKPRRHSFAPFIFRPSQVPRVSAPPRPAPAPAPAPARATPSTPPPPAPAAPEPYVDPTHPAVSLPPPPPPNAARRQSYHPPASPKTVALHNELALLDPELVPSEFGANRRYSDIERRLGSPPKASSMAWSGPGGVRENSNSGGDHHTPWSIGWRSGRH